VSRRTHCKGQPVGLGVLLLAAAALGGSCAAQKPTTVDFSEGTRAFQPEDYQTVRATWTRHGSIVRDVGTVLEVWAVFKSSEFRQAFVEHYAEVYGLKDDDEAELRAQQLAAARDQYEFHVAAQSTKYEWNDLEQRDSAWKVTLVDATGAELAPARIELVRLPEIYENQFFPSRTDFTRTYRITFPRTPPGDEGPVFRGPATGQIGLRFSGPLGRAEVTWQAKP
jgi:hypothetical protein